MGGPVGDGAVLMIDFDRQPERGVAGVAAGPGLAARVRQASLDALVAEVMDPALAEGDWLTAVTQGIVALSTAGRQRARAGTPAPGATRGPPGHPGPGSVRRAAGRPPGPRWIPALVPDIGPAPAPRPPWPDPIDGVRVYDHADVLEDATIVSLGDTSRRIEDRTGAQVVVYTQVKPESDTPSEAERDAISLMDAWGVGRRGIDDGLVILLDLDDSRCHGQVQLYAGPGYRASYLTNDDRQAIYEDVMLPHLRGVRLRLGACSRRWRASTRPPPRRAPRRWPRRDRWMRPPGLVVAPLVVIGLLGWAGWSWLRYGKDPELVDDPSVLMPAPPSGLSAGRRGRGARRARQAPRPDDRHGGPRRTRRGAVPRSGGSRPDAGGARAHDAGPHRPARGPRSAHAPRGGGGIRAGAAAGDRRRLGPDRVHGAARVRQARGRLRGSSGAARGGPGLVP